MSRGVEHYENYEQEHETKTGRQAEVARAPAEQEAEGGSVGGRHHAPGWDPLTF